MYLAMELMFCDPVCEGKATFVVLAKWKTDTYLGLGHPLLFGFPNSSSS